MFVRRTVTIGLCVSPTCGLYTVPAAQMSADTSNSTVYW